MNFFETQKFLLWFLFCLCSETIDPLFYGQNLRMVILIKRSLMKYNEYISYFHMHWPQNEQHLILFFQRILRYNFYKFKSWPAEPAGLEPARCWLTDLSKYVRRPKPLRHCGLRYKDMSSTPSLNSKQQGGVICFICRGPISRRDKSSKNMRERICSVWRASKIFGIDVRLEKKENIYI